MGEVPSDGINGTSERCDLRKEKHFLRSTSEGRERVDLEEC